MTSQFGKPMHHEINRVRGGRCRRGRAAPAQQLVGAIGIAAGLAFTGCAGNAGTTTERPPDRPADRPPTDTAWDDTIIDNAEFRRDPIRAFREPAYAIEGRPVVLFPSPPRDLTAWWLPPVPELRATDSGRLLSARLVWLAATGGTNAPRGDALAWLGGTTGLGAARWSGLPANDAARLADSDADADRARLGDSGFWVVLVDDLRPGESIALVRDQGEANEALDMRRLAPLPAGATDLSPLHPPHWAALDRSASVRLAESLAAAWRDPLQRWRVRLLADRFAGDGSFVTPLAGDGAGDPVVDEIAAQFERLWREALGTLLQRDAALAAEAFAALLPIVELAPGVPLPVWRADAGTEWALLAAMLNQSLDERAMLDRIRTIARAIREARPAMIGWIDQDAALDEGGFDPARVLVRSAELHGRARRATVEGGSTATPAAEVPGMGAASFAVELAPGSGVGASRLTLRSGALSQPMPTATRAAPVVAPRYTINALWRAWTADGFLSGQPAPAVLQRGDRFVPATAAILTRDPVQRRWVLFIECLRDPAATRGDELRVWFNAAEPIVVLSSGALRDTPGVGGRVELLAHESLADRWSATLAFIDRDAEASNQEDAGGPAAWTEPVRFALQRSEQLNIGGTRTSSWPRPKFPGQSPGTPSGTMGLDLTAWDRALDGAESFEALRRDDQRARDAFEAWREEEPLPGPMP